MTTKPLYLGNELWLTPPPEKGSGRAFMFALGMHLLLFLFLYVGIRWKNETPAAVEAELWSSIPLQEAPQPVPEPVQPIEKVTPLPPAPPEKIEPKVEKPDIALEQEKLRKKKEQELKEKQEKERKEKERKEKEQKEKIQLEKLKEQNRADEMKRLQATSKNPQPAGTDAQTSSPSPEWEGLVAAAIKANINYHVPADLKPGPKALFQIRLLPSGELLGAPKLIKSSGIPSYDEAVERAIRKTDPLPRPKNGIYPRALELEFDPLDKGQ
ncbi:MAG: TonB C-terminal domain-containing protein [Burkholderiaceae bacterium]|nr:MAG: TonB C-terminal domain-containing protein [Burkholderiaceae bacterium]